MLLNLPEVPISDRPKKLPYGENLPLADFKTLKDKGWSPYDVRLMANQTDGDRAEAVKSFLEGVRLGTISADAGLLRFIELEAKVYGLLTGRQAGTKSQDEINDSQALESILSFGTKTPWATSDEEKKDKQHRRRGPKKKDAA